MLLLVPLTPQQMVAEPRSPLSEPYWTGVLSRSVGGRHVLPWRSALQ